MNISQTKKNIVITILSFTLIIGVMILAGAHLYKQNGGEFILKGENEFARDYTSRKFKNASEYKQYVKESLQMEKEYFEYEDDSTIPLPPPIQGGSEIFNAPDLPLPSLDSNTKYEGRYSETNTRVVGIDESDILKNNGSQLFYVNPGRYSYDYELFDLQPGSSQSDRTQIIQAFPAEDAELLTEIERGGKIYLFDQLLISEEENNVVGYDIADPSEPVKDWEITLQEDLTLIDSKLLNEHIYLFATQRITNEVCSIPLMKSSSQGMRELDCSDIYYSTPPNSTPSMITILKVDPIDGELIDSFTVLTDGREDLIYVSPYNIYITYEVIPDSYNIIEKFINSRKDLFPTQLLQQIEKVQGYEISNEAKQVEMFKIIDQHVRSLGYENAENFRRDAFEAYLSYVEDNQQQFFTTGILKIDVQNMSSNSEGFVEGKIPDQFAIDEYNGLLRVATHIPGSMIAQPYLSFFSYEGTSIIPDNNMVVVLDDNLQRMGEIGGLGQNEKIYSTRFIGEAAYLVTFREVDPFYVIDLSEPSEPMLLGELKIPGYSSYLHQLSNDLILGIGEDGFRVKSTLFDVSDPSNPQELSTYQMPAYWTEIEQNHRAFLHDQLNSLFFVPTNSGGFVISYENNDLRPVKIIDMPSIERAAFIGNYIYFFGSDELTIFDMNSWEQVKKIYLTSFQPGV